MIYLLGIYDDPLIARSTAFVFLTVESIMLGVNCFFYGMYSIRSFEIAAFLIIPYGAAIWIGAHLSSGVAAHWYRRIILGFLLILSISLTFRAA